MILALVSHDTSLLLVIFPDSSIALSPFSFLHGEFICAPCPPPRPPPLSLVYALGSCSGFSCCCLWSFPWPSVSRSSILLLLWPNHKCSWISVSLLPLPSHAIPCLLSYLTNVPERSETNWPLHKNNGGIFKHKYLKRDFLTVRSCKIPNFLLQSCSENCDYDGGKQNPSIVSNSACTTWGKQEEFDPLFVDKRTKSEIR